MFQEKQHFFHSYIGTLVTVVVHFQEKLGIVAESDPLLLQLVIRF